MYHNLIYICQVVCLSVCLSESSERPDRWTNPHQIWYGGLTLQGPGHRLCFGPRGGPPGSGGPKTGSGENLQPQL
jgi:hypothetical protein